MVSAGGEKPALCPAEGSVGFPPATPLLFRIIPQTCLDTSAFTPVSASSQSPITCPRGLPCPQPMTLVT